MKNSLSKDLSITGAVVVMGFECDKCGLCCRNVHLLPGYEFLNRGDGVCRYLTADNHCSIYDHRPDVCNIDRLYESKVAGKMTREQFYELNYAVCNELKAKAAAHLKEQGNTEGALQCQPQELAPVGSMLRQQADKANLNQDVSEYVAASRSSARQINAQYLGSAKDHKR